jgi:hypothetical protein
MFKYLVITIAGILFLKVSYSQIQKDTIIASYSWSFEPVFASPTHREAFQEKTFFKTNSHHKEEVKKFFSTYIRRFSPSYTHAEITSLITKILESDEVMFSRTSTSVFEIWYGDYHDSGFGLLSVGSYTHCVIDISKTEIVPQFSMTITY